MEWRWGCNSTATTDPALPLCWDFTPCLYLARDSNSLKSFPKNECGFINLRQAVGGRATAHQIGLEGKASSASGAGTWIENELLRKKHSQVLWLLQLLAGAGREEQDTRIDQDVPTWLQKGFRVGHLIFFSLSVVWECSFHLCWLSSEGSSSLFLLPLL